MRGIERGMILERSSAHEVTDEDVRELVMARQRETDHLEFKRERTDDLPQHACAIANVGGGYIVVGIQVDGEDRAQAVSNIDKAESVSTSIRQQLGEAITPRPLYEVVPLLVDAQHVIIIRIAPNNGPHMVSLGQRTEFYTRCGTQSLFMRYPEIEQQFREKLVAGSIDEVPETPQSYVESTLGRRLMTTGAAGTLEQIATSISLSDQSMLAIFSVADRMRRTLNEEDAVGIFREPTYNRHAGWMVVHDKLDVAHNGGDITQDYGAASLTKLTPSCDFIFLKAVDEILCWRQPEVEFVHSPRLYPNALVEYCLSFAFSCGDIIAIARPETLAIVVMLVNAQNAQLPPGEGGTVWFDNPISAPPRLQTKLLRSRVIPLDARERHHPRRLAFDIARQIYGFFGYDGTGVAFAEGSEISFGADDFNVRISAIGSYLQTTLGVRFEHPLERRQESSWWFRADRDMKRFTIGVSRELVEESGSSEEELFALLDKMNIADCAIEARGSPVLITTRGCEVTRNL
jgi:hypothetical protein